MKLEIEITEDEIRSAAVPTVKVVEILPTKVWIESDMMGARHVVMHHQGYGEPFTYASFHYDYAYTSNGGTWDAAHRLALDLGATEPVEQRQRDFHFPTADELREQIKGMQGMLASLGRARGLLVELDSVLRMAESHNGGALTAAHVRAAVEPYLPLDLGPNTEAQRLEDWHEDDGPALWWRFPLNEPPYCGHPNCDDWPGYHTHWTPLVVPDAPAVAVAAEAA